MATAYPIRPISQGEFRAFYAVLEHAFNATYPTDLELQHDLGVSEFDRSLAAFDGTEMVGTAIAITFQMTVPGGAAAVAGVTGVTVLPSHRRRGILSSLMHRQLADIRDRGEAIAALFASEAGIYGRYGYGAATAELDLTIRRGEGALSAPVDAGPEGSITAPLLRIVEPQRAVAEMALVYGSVQRERPGMLARDDRWWEHILWDPEHRRSGGGPLRGLIPGDDTGPRGYALYSASADWGEDALPNGKLQVRELMATDAADYAAIWNDLLGRDLIGEVRARMRPVDEPLLYLLADQRRARPKLGDGLWVRLVSVPEALTRRKYACPVDVVIDVADDVFAENAGRWRLWAPGAAAGGDPAVQVPASCERTSAPADVTLPVRALSAAYLGGTRLSALAAAGLVHETRSGAVAALSTSMSCEPAPWCPTSF
jgi:predicted acetyltransferase